MKKIMELKPGDVVISSDYGMGEVSGIRDGKISVVFTDMTEWTYNAFFCEELAWYQDNCRLPDAKEAQICSDYINACQELLREAEEYGEPFYDEWDWEYSVDGHIVEECDYFWSDADGFGKVEAIYGKQYLILFRDPDLGKGCSVLKPIDWLAQNCRYMPDEKAEQYLDRFDEPIPVLPYTYLSDSDI